MLQSNVLVYVSLYLKDRSRFLLTYAFFLDFHVCKQFLALWLWVFNYRKVLFFSLNNCEHLFKDLDLHIRHGWKSVNVKVTEVAWCQCRKDFDVFCCLKCLNWELEFTRAITIVDIIQEENFRTEKRKLHYKLSTVSMKLAKNLIVIMSVFYYISARNLLSETVPNFR